MTARHILIPIHDFSAGGTEIIAFRLAEAWLARGRRVTILAGARDGPMAARVPAGAAVEMLAPPIPRSPVSRLRLGAPMAEAARRLAPDVVFLPGNFHFILARALRAAMPGIPVVAKISNPLIPAHAAAPVRALAAFVLRRLTFGISHLCAMSDGLAGDCRALLGAIPVSTIHDPFLDDDAPIIARPGSSADGPLRLVGIGRLEPQKDWPLAMAAVKALSARRPCSLVIHGEGALRPRLEAEIARLGLAGRVTLPGFCADVNAALDAADLLLVSSAYEGGPAVAVEALARGVPFAATDCSHFLRDLVVTPGVGTLAKAAGPQALAEAVAAQAARPFPDAAAIESAVARSRLTPAVEAWLAVFDRLAGAGD
ncbi:glycosyltransferase [Novosphingobium bradum]|uniref:Glycosyltransferase n=1 Tax=Novosphingobium bradum TaxID=1737444 RepID=A0ABV7IW85_9SPHN